MPPRPPPPISPGWGGQVHRGTVPRDEMRGKPPPRVVFIFLFTTSISRQASQETWTSALQAVNRNPRGKHVSNLASVPEHPAEEHHSVPVTPKTAQNSPTFRQQSNSSQPKLAKHLTCWYWANKGCKLPDHSCLYSHFDTGKLAEPPVQVFLLYTRSVFTRTDQYGSISGCSLGPTSRYHGLP